MQPPGTHERQQQHTDYWLARLRDGDPAQKAEARWRLAAGFEAQGMPAQAVELLVANAREGFRTPELFEAISRLYRQLGNEYLATSAAVEAARLRERATGGPSVAPPGPPPTAGYRIPTNPQSSGGAATSSTAVPPQPFSAPPFSAPAHSQSLPSSQSDPRWQQAYGDPFAPRPTPRPPASPATAPASFAHRWLPTVRIIGWIVAAVLLATAIGVGSMQPVAGVAYALAAGALALTLTGRSGFRRWLHVPTGPLGDGGLIFVAVLLFLAGGAMLPRPAATSPTTPDPVAPPRSTPATLYRGTPTPTPSPAAGNVVTGTLIGQLFIVVGDEAGGYLRVSPGSTRGGVFVGDGDVVVAISEDRTVSGILWRDVRVSDNEHGWIEVSRLRPAPTERLPAFPNGQPPAGRACAGAAGIKGNVNSAGELVYLRVGQEWYYRTFPEVCFRTEADAQAAGFRPSPR